MCSNVSLNYLNEKNSRNSCFCSGYSEFSFGQTFIESYINYKDLFSEDPINNFNFGFSASYNPHQSVLFVNSGLLFKRVYDQDNSLNFFKIPIGMDLAFGKRLKIFFGGGTYINWLFHTTGSYSQEPPNTHNIIIGLYCDLGVRYLIVNDWSIYLKTRMEFDQSTLYSYDQGINYRSYDYGVVIGFRYLIPSKKAENN